MSVGATINQHKTHELNVEFDVYAPSRGPNIPCQRYRGMNGVIIKLMPKEGTYNLHGHVFLGLEGD